MVKDLSSRHGRSSGSPDDFIFFLIMIGMPIIMGIAYAIVGSK